MDSSRNVTIAELKQICRKGSLDPHWISNIFWRPVSIYFTWLFVLLGVTENQITFVSMIFAIASSIVLLFPSVFTFVAWIVLVQSFFLLDHVDGELARYYASRHAKSGGLSGQYFDILVHYFQGPSFYICLSAGLATKDSQVLWLLPGLVGAIGSSGSPRLTASYHLLPLLLTKPSEHVKSVAAKVSDGNWPFWKKDEVRSGFFIFPSNKKELVLLLRQYVMFPGNFFLFTGAMTIDIFVSTDSFTGMKIALLAYSVVHLSNLVYTSRKYFKLLSRV